MSHLQRQPLSRGMAIDAAIDARLLGLRLLRLNARITVLPPDPVGWRGDASVTNRRSTGTLEPNRPLDPNRPLMVRTRVPSSAMNGRGVGRLTQAARSLAASNAALEATRSERRTRQIESRRIG
jgi:hypothetical protein